MAELKLGKVACVGPARGMIHAVTPMRTAGLDVTTFPGMLPEEQIFLAGEFECAVLVTGASIQVRDNWTGYTKRSSLVDVVKDVKACLTSSKN